MQKLQLLNNDDGEETNSLARHDYVTRTRCLKITEKVSFNNASKASYAYILNRQKLIKNAKNGQIVLPDMSVLIGQKLVENAKIKKLKCNILSNFQTM